jgi:hypothetical protein
MQEELDYYALKNLQVPPEERCQGEKEEWYFRDSSWYMRGWMVMIDMGAMPVHGS